MVYITGDLHGDITRFSKGKLRRLGKKDTLIVLGDFGFLWDESEQEKKNLKWLAKRKFNILFIDGTHDNFDLLAKYPYTEIFGAKVQNIAGFVYHVCRGSILEIEGKKILCFGGGESEDIEDREIGVNWWAAEMPSHEDMIACVENLKRVNFEVDYILTHDAPSKLLNFNVLKHSEENELHRFLDKIILKTKYKKWFFGRYHKDLALSTKASCVFLDIIPLKD